MLDRVSERRLLVNVPAPDSRDLLRSHHPFQEAMDAHLVAWVYASRNELRDEETMLAALSEDLQLLSHKPGEVSDWFTSVDQRDDGISMDLIWSLRTMMTSRRAKYDTVRRALSIFLHLAPHPIMQKYTMEVAIRPSRPVCWIMKAMQRQLSTCVEDTGLVSVTKGGLAVVGLGSLVYVLHFSSSVIRSSIMSSIWCNEMKLDAIYIVHYKLRVSIIPYLSLFAIYASEGSNIEFQSERLGVKEFRRRR